MPMMAYGTPPANGQSSFMVHCQYPEVFEYAQTARAFMPLQSLSSMHWSFAVWQK
jgi:hypothetical protein